MQSLNLNAADEARTVAYVECDRLRDRAAPGIAGPIKINDKAHVCIEVLVTGEKYAGRSIRPGEPIGIVVSKPHS